MKKYCGPLELISERKILDIEIQYLVDAKTTLSKDAVISGAIFLLCMIVLAALIVMDKRLVNPYVMSVCVIILTVGACSSGAWFYKSVKKFRIVTRNLNPTLVEEFYGLISPDLYLGSLEGIRDHIAGKDDENVRLVLKQETGLVISINGASFVDECFFATTQHLATPEHEQFTVSAPIHDWIENSLSTGKFERRHFTEEERKELSEKISALIWHGINPQLFPFGFFLFLLFYRKNYILTAIIAVILLLIGFFRTWPELKLAWSLKSDLSEGTVFVVGENSIEGGNPKFEFLPYSGMLWTKAGYPSGVRLLE